MERTQIIGEILAMLAQTHYANEENVNSGPYMALVGSEGEDGGTVVKSIAPWVVDSKILLEGDKQVNRVQVCDKFTHKFVAHPEAMERLY